MNRDLEYHIARWRSEFERRHIFGWDDVEELEEHLRDALAAAQVDGIPPGDAFEGAVTLIGTADALYEDYWREWKQAGWFRRYLRAMRNDFKGFRSPKPRLLYGVCRVTSLVAALFLSLPLITWFRTGFRMYWLNGVDVFSQPSVALSSILLILVLTLLPFRGWSNSSGDWIRLVFAGIGSSWAMGWLLQVLQPDSGPMPWYGVLTLVLATLLGPATWAFQARARRTETS